MHSFFILCKKNTKNQKQMFIFYVSLTLYKLFGNCQVDNGGVLSDSCYFCNISVPAPAAWQGRERGCVLTEWSNAGDLRWCAVYRIFLCIPHLGFSVAPGQRANGTRGPWCQWDLWPSM